MMDELTPRKIVSELDKYIVGQQEAKRAVAIAIRNRWRRQKLPPDLRDEVAPKNILMIGPTGVGKTEIARRLAALVDAPFLKVEATKYTEVGYVGRDVESMVRDLVEISYNMAKTREFESVRTKARRLAEDRILELLPAVESESSKASPIPLRRQLRARLRRGELDNEVIELRLEERSMPMIDIISSAGVEQMGVDFQNFFDRMIPKKTTLRKVTVKEALDILTKQEAEQLIDNEKVKREAVTRAQEMGIIFIDELDKIAGPQVKGAGPDVSREGVQRDLLPIIEGSSVLTRYGIVHTAHILFIAAGAFHSAKPSDLIPELQGRLPIRVQLSELRQEDFVKILTEPQNALTKQYLALLSTENVKIRFDESAVDEIARIAAEINNRTQNIGARRLQTVMEKLVEEISFDAPDLAGQEVLIDRAYVQKRLSSLLADEDLSRYVL